MLISGHDGPIKARSSEGKRGGGFTTLRKSVRSISLQAVPVASSVDISSQPGPPEHQRVIDSLRLFHC